MIRKIWLVYFALMGLLAVTTAMAFVPIGETGATLIALGIATTKALLVILFFMELKQGKRLTYVFAGVGFFWLGILLSLAMSDYMTRGWLPTGQ